MSKFLVAFLCLVCFSTIGQIEVDGQIINKRTNEPVPYVSIGVVGAYKGTVSDLDGKFHLSLDEKFADSSIRISMYGFEELNFKLAELKERLLKSGPRILFSEKVFDQKEVVVVGEEMKEKVLGREVTNDNLMIQFLSDQLGAQIGTIVKVKKKTILRDFNFYLRQSGYDSVTFRLNFYDYDVKTDTGDSLIAESIVFHVVGDHDSTYTLDLSDHYIQLKEDFIAAIEIVGGSREGGMERNPTIWFGGGFGGGCKAKIASQSAWLNVPVSAVGFYMNVWQAKKKK